MEIKVVNKNSLNFKEIVDSSLNAIFILDKDNHVIYVNKKCLQLLKVTKEEFLSNGLKYYLFEEFHEVCRQRISSAFNGKTAELMEQKVLRADGEMIYIEAMCSPLKGQYDILVQVTIRDITERKISEQNLIQAEKLSMVGEVAAGIVHEIRNPLTTISGFLDLIKKEYEGSSEKYVNIMKDEVKRIEKIANDLLHLSKPKEVHQLKPENTIEIIKSVIFLWETETFRKGISINLSYNEEVIQIKCEKSQIMQVFINLIKNAIEACDHNGEIYIIIERNDTEVIIQIRDTGHGIPSELLNKIGTSFKTTKSDGTGLGLMVTYNIIKKHNGKITLESKEGEGATFIITFPLLQ